MGGQPALQLLCEHRSGWRTREALSAFLNNVPQEDHGTAKFKAFIKIHTRQVQFAVLKPTC